MEGPVEKFTDLYQFSPSWIPDDPQWDREAACKGAGSDTVWFTSGELDGVTIDGEPAFGRSAHTVAVERYCQSCPAQWDCAMWAVRNFECVGVWAMTIRDLSWLQGFGGGDIVVHAAADQGVPVSVMVANVRRCVEGPSTQRSAV